MSPARQFAVIFISALMGGLLALGGFIGWESAHPQTALLLPPGQGTQTNSSDQTNPKAQLTNANLGSTPLAGLGNASIGATGSIDPEEQIFTQVYHDAAPCVVHIHTTSHVPTWFGVQEAKGSGSGVIISADGYILTNNHVVAGAGGHTELSVTLHDGSEHPATIQGIDLVSDLAVIKLSNPPPSLPVAKLGESDTLREGQRAIVIGNPYGLDSSITVGVISALKRTVNAENTRYEGMIQTDAAVNPGNSGGPLLNSQGLVIGINTVIFSQSGGSQGIGFAIPIDLAKQVLHDLVTYGKVQRPDLGVSGELIPMTPSIAGWLGINVNGGVMVQTVVPGGSADLAGIKGGSQPVSTGDGNYVLIGGDIIISVNGQRVNKGDDVVSIVRRLKVGDAVSVQIWREGELLTKSVKLQVQK